MALSAQLDGASMTSGTLDPTWCDRATVKGMLAALTASLLQLGSGLLHLLKLVGLGVGECRFIEGASEHFLKMNNPFLELIAL